MVINQIDIEADCTHSYIAYLLDIKDLLSVDAYVNSQSRGVTGGGPSQERTQL